MDLHSSKVWGAHDLFLDLKPVWALRLARTKKRVRFLHFILGMFGRCSCRGVGSLHFQPFSTKQCTHWFFPLALSLQLPRILRCSSYCFSILFLGSCPTLQTSWFRGEMVGGANSIAAFSHPVGGPGDLVLFGWWVHAGEGKHQDDPQNGKMQQ